MFIDWPNEQEEDGPRTQTQVHVLVNNKVIEPLRSSSSTFVNGLVLSWLFLWPFSLMLPFS
jgi:hypothetical protein